MRHLKLTEDRIFDASLYKAADAASYLALLKHLQSKKYRIDPIRGHLARLSKGFEHCCYKADEPLLKIDARNKISAGQITHQGLHSWVKSAFSGPARNHPLLTLLNECIGLGAETYFVMSYIGKKGIPTEGYFASMLMFYVREAKHLGRSIRKLLNESISDPYQAFVKTTEAAFAVHHEYYIQLTAPLLGKKPRWDRVLGRMKSLPYFVFANYYSLALPPHYLAAQCGIASGAEDRRQAERCLAIIRLSKSFSEFLKSLSDPVALGSRAGILLPSPHGAGGKEVARPKIPFEKAFTGQSPSLGEERLKEFFLNHLVAIRAEVDPVKTEIALKNERAFWDFDLFLPDQGLYFDQGRKISPRQWVTFSAGHFAAGRLNGFRKGFPATSALIYAFCDQLLIYMEDLGKPSGSGAKAKEKCFKRFKEALLLEHRFLLSLLNQSRRVASGGSADAALLLKQAQSLHPAKYFESALRSGGMRVNTIAASCGFDPSKRDRSQVAKWTARMKNSKSLPELVEEMASGF